MQKEPEQKSGKLVNSIFDEPATEQERLAKKPKYETTKAREWSRWKKENWRSLRPNPRDPMPKARVRWQRKIVIRDVCGRHRLNKSEKLLRSERFHNAKSPFIKTSIKKLGPLARQIAGKSLDEALIQMRFSKKKAAQDVLKHLKYARDQAIVAKGMGTGQEITPDLPDPALLAGKKKTKFEPITFRDNKGKKRVITDPSAIYIEQAWVGRGTPGYGIDHKPRGRAYKLDLPYTSKSFQQNERVP